MKKEKKNAFIIVRITSEEKRLILEKAKDNDMTFSEIIRHIIKGAIK